MMVPKAVKAIKQMVALESSSISYQMLREQNQTKDQYKNPLRLQAAHFLRPFR